MLVSQNITLIPATSFVACQLLLAHIWNVCHTAVTERARCYTLVLAHILHCYSMPMTHRMLKKHVARLGERNRTEWNRINYMTLSRAHTSAKAADTAHFVTVKHTPRNIIYRPLSRGLTWPTQLQTQCHQVISRPQRPTKVSWTTEKWENFKCFTFL